MSSEDKKVCTRIITQSRKYFIKLEEDFDKNVKILVTDGKSVWESSKSKFLQINKSITK
jgi:spermidine synthase